MRLIDADEVQERIKANESAYDAWSYRNANFLLDAAPTVDAPQPLTRDGVLAAVKAIEDAGGKAVVEVLPSFTGQWAKEHIQSIKDWCNPDNPRWNVRVRAVEVETEDVPLTQLVGRTIKGCHVPVSYQPVHHTGQWWWQGPGGATHAFPEGTLNLETGQVTVVKGEA